MKKRRFAASGSSAVNVTGDEVPSYQPLGIDGYHPYGVVADWDQIGVYVLPLASVSKKNNVGMLRHDGVEGLNSSPNVYMPQWSAPARGQVVNQTGGMAQNPLASYDAAQATANPFSANADAASLAAAFMASRSPRYSGVSSMSGE